MIKAIEKAEDVYHTTLIIASNKAEKSIEALGADNRTAF